MVPAWHTLTPSHSPTCQPFWAAVSAPCPSTGAALLTTHLQALGVPSPPKESSCLDFTPLSRSQQFLWVYPEEATNLSCVKTAPTEHTALLPAHRPTAQVALESLLSVLPCLGKKGGTDAALLGSWLPHPIRILWEFMLKSLLICKNWLHTHLMYGPSINSAWPGPSRARTFPFAACWI